jgi:hypothetical protein
MSYSAEISRSKPTAFLILIDQSYSMSESFGGGHGSKAEEAARVVNRMLAELTIKCAKGDDQIYDYFDVGVLGYGQTVGNAFAGSLGSSLFQPISHVADNPLRLDTISRKVPDGAGGLVEEEVAMPVWIDPATNGHTPMCQALDLAKSAVSAWVSDHPEAFPPTVINITDGESTDGDPSPVAHDLASLSTGDGNVLLFNCHISASPSTPLLFPATLENPPGHVAATLFGMSSMLPSKHLELAQSEGVAVSQGSRGFAFNAKLVDLTIFLEVGTRLRAISAELR